MIFSSTRNSLRIRNSLRGSSILQFTFLFVLSAVFLSAVSVKASAWQATPEPPTPAVTEPAASASSEPSAAAEKASKKEEVAERDDTAQFKQSPTVLGLGRLLGINGTKAYWLAVIVNFAVIALGVIYMSRLHLPTMFRNRTDSIRKAMDEAKIASEDAKRRLTEIETRLGRLDSEIAGMRASAEKDGAAEEARIRASAEEDKKKIVEAAQQEIATATKSARRDLASYAADLALDLARQRIRVDLPTDQALVSSFAQSLGKDAQ